MSEWPTRPLRAVAEVALGRQRSPQHAEGPNMVPYLRAANVVDGRLDLSNVLSMNFTPNEQRIFSLRRGDVLVTEGSGSLRSVGATAVYDGEIAGTVCFQNTLLRLRPRNDAVDGRFLQWWARATYAAGTFASVASGANIHHVSAQRVRALSIRVPPIEEQRRIADFLDAETARIAGLEDARRQQVSLLRERLASQWSDQVDNLAVAHGWTALRRFVASITDGPFGSGLTSDHYSDEGARVVRLGNIGRAIFRDADKAYIPNAYARQLRRHEVRPGDLLIAGLGDENYPLGRACVAPRDIGPAIVKADCFRLRLDQRKVTHEYAAWALSSPPVAQQVVFLARGSTRARINLNVAREIAIPVPSLGEQAATCDARTKARDEVSAIERRCRQQLALLAERRQALITAAVTGQLDPATARAAAV